MSEPIINIAKDDELPKLVPIECFTKKVYGDFIENVFNRSLVKSLSVELKDSSIFEEGVRYAIAHLNELVTQTSLLAYVQALHKKYFPDDKHRDRLIEKFVTMTFADSHNASLIRERLPGIVKMVDAVICAQAQGQPIINVNEDGKD